MIRMLLVIWREAFEAMLVIGILHSWIKRQILINTRIGILSIIIGLMIGLSCATCIAWIMITIKSNLIGMLLDYFNLFIMFLAIYFLVKTVFWMNQYINPEEMLNIHTNKNSIYKKIIAVSALSIARESTEVIILLYGFNLELENVWLWWITIFIGIACGWITFLIIRIGSNILSANIFFQLSTIILLVLASGLVVSATEKVIVLEWITFGLNEVWDSTFLIDDSSQLGNIFANLTGYRSHPSLSALVIYLVYWFLIIISLYRKKFFT